MDIDLNFDIDLDYDLSLDNSKSNIPKKAKIPAKFKNPLSLDNLYLTDFEFGLNDWEIPETKPFADDLTGIEWYDFGNISKVKDYSNAGIHFYIDDYKFNVMWNTPNKWIDILKQCRAVVTPDFSNYTDMPYVQQLWNHYRRQWCGRYWQERGIKVISSLSWANGQMEEWAFAGIPQNTICATSFVGDNIDKECSLYELQAVVRALKPYKLFIKTNKSDEYWLKNYFDFEVIPPYSFNRKEKNYAKRK